MKQINSDVLSEGVSCSTVIQQGCHLMTYSFDSFLNIFFSHHDVSDLHVCLAPSHSPISDSCCHMAQVILKQWKDTRKNKRKTVSSYSLGLAPTCLHALH